MATLCTGLTTTGQRVFASRIFSLSQDDLPSLSVFDIINDNEEVVTRATLATPSLITRQCPIVIEGHAEVDQDIDVVLDNIASEVEAAMSVMLTIGSRPLPAQLQSTAKELSGDGDLMIGVIRLKYLVTYSTFENAPQTLA